MCPTLVSTIQGRLKLFVLLLLGLYITSPVSATTWTVTSTSDDGSNAATLRYAIVNATSGDTINFSLPPSSTITLTNGQLNIVNSLTISGTGATDLTISGNNASRVFYINSSITVNISDITIANGSATIGGGVYDYYGTLNLTNCTISDNSASNSGGGIYIHGTLNLTNVTVSDNTAASGDGGGIYNEIGTATITDSTISDNWASPGDGGGIENAAGQLTVTGSTVSGNSASNNGGGIHTTSTQFFSGELTITDSTISDNSAQYGGGIEIGSTATVSGSTISGNSGAFGGGIHNENTLTLTNTTISGNSDAYSGSGLINGGSNGTVTLTNVTVSGNLTNGGSSDAAIYNNVLGNLTLKSTILANGGSNANCNSSLYSGPRVSDGYNLSDDTSCSSFLTATGDVNNTSAGLDPEGLEDNGGPTKTIALISTSAAVDAIPVSPTNYCTLPDGTTPVATDQRGITRPQGPACDIGAFELVGTVPFSSFSAKLDILAGSSRPRPHRPPSFALNAIYTLATSSDGIDPLTEGVVLQVGTYNVTIPANSFQQLEHGSKKGSYVYSGVIGGVSLSIQIEPLGDYTYQFKAKGSPVDLTALSNPMSVTLTIGDDTGTTAVYADF